MITPDDIATKYFSKVEEGYSPEEVDTFLDEIYEDYEVLYLEKKNQPISVEEPVSKSEDKVLNLDKILERTLVLAENAAQEAKEAAIVESANIIKSAKLEAEEIMRLAKVKNYELEQEMSALESRYELMCTRIKLLLYAEIELIDKNEIISEKKLAKAETE